MIRSSSRNSPLLAIALPIGVVALAAWIMLFDPFGKASIFAALGLAFAVGGWAVRQRLKDRDEVLGAAFRSSFVIGAPVAIMLSILTVAFAARFAPFGDALTNWITSLNDNPALSGFAIGVAFTALMASTCVLVTRAIWWIQKNQDPDQ